MRSILLVSIITAIAINAFAETTAVTDDGRKVLLKSDGTWQYTKEARPEQKARYADEAVTIWDVSLQHLDADNSMQRYSPIVALTFHFKNNTDKKVIGVSVLCVIKNPFGKEVLRETYDNEVVIRPNERMKNNLSWIMEDNQFIDDQPYDRLKLIAANGTARITTKVLKVIFEDGTVLKSK